MLGLWDSEAVCAPAGKASITPKTARLGSSNSLRRANRRMIDPRCAETNVQQHTYKLIRALRGPTGPSSEVRRSQASEQEHGPEAIRTEGPVTISPNWTDKPARASFR